MRYGKMIKPGDAIGLPAPSFGASTEPYTTRVNAAIQRLREMGYAVKPGSNAFAGEGVGISNTPEKCAAELQEMWESKETDALLSVGGGELMCEILNHMDFDRIARADAKWYMGYSDNTNFLFPLATICDTAGIYGPCASEFGLRSLHESQTDALDLFLGKHAEIAEDGTSVFSVHSYETYEPNDLTGDHVPSEEDPLAPMNATEPRIHKLYLPDSDELLMDAREWTGEISFSGRLLGGCIDCLVNLMGTGFEDVAMFRSRYAKDGVIWFLEACDLNVFSIRRAMWEMDSAGWFHGCKGFLFGRHLNGAPMMNLDAYEAVLPYARKYHVPVIMDTDIGHVSPMMPLIVGSLAHVRAFGNELEIQMHLV
ncbi:MAG: LD-carboxypeptidase [Lachnospiraceae bacterium]|nr:LD-carboxypeptidase [Lachnospiraceae bacterium]